MIRDGVVYDDRGKPCPICNHTDRVFCSVCFEEITMHSHEGDYICKTHTRAGAVWVSREKRRIAFEDRIRSGELA